MPEETHGYSTHFLDPKPTTGIYSLPCGFVDDEGNLHRGVHLREMTGVEEEVLAGTGEVGAKLDRVIANCLVSIGAAEQTGLSVVKRLPVVDRVFLVIALRRVSLGDNYRIEAKCPHCGETHKYDIDLGALTVREMAEPEKRSFEGTLPSGRQFKWHVMTGDDEDWLNEAKKRLKGHGAVTLAMMARIDELDGQALPKDPKHRRELVASVEAISKLGLRDRNYLRRTFTDFEGDVDTSIEFSCESCGSDFSADMRVDPQAFFFPSEM